MLVIAEPEKHILDVSTYHQKSDSTTAPLLNVKHNEPIWPDYFARRGQADATTWHYKGYWTDSIRVWRAYYTFVLRHPIKTFYGCQQFFKTLAYRVFGQAAGDRISLLISIAVPVLAISTPVLALIAVAIASIPYVKKSIPPLFQPFTYMGWVNYCVMLSLVFTWHGYRQYKQKLHPMEAFQHSSKIFWNDFFTKNLPAGQRATKILSTYKQGHLSSPLPRENIVIKPVSGGAGHKLRSLTWDHSCEVYRCNDVEQKPTEPKVFTPYELGVYIQSLRTDLVIEQWEQPRNPLPVSSLRVLTINTSSQTELLCAVFLPAPEGSVSTAYFDLDIYLINHCNNCIGEPLNPASSRDYCGMAIPEVSTVIDTCISLHNRLPQHLEISWDVILTEDAPVFLEGNVFPPGCDYKLSIFKNDDNIRFLKKKIIGLT